MKKKDLRDMTNQVAREFQTESDVEAFTKARSKQLAPYLDNGELPLGNNAGENVIRPFVIGRKNGLFSQRVDGANASATIYSLIETSRLNGQEPYRYLRYVLTEIAKGNEDYVSL